MVKNLISDFLYRKLTFSYVYDDKPAKAGGKETIVMKMKKLAALVLAAAVLTTTVAPSVATPVYAATAEQTATDATPEQEVAVKKPSKATVTAKDDSVKVTIKKVAGAEGYQIQYSTSKKFTKKTTKSKTTKKTSYTVKNLKNKKTYYVRVRAYKLDANGKKVYSKWTTVKKTITK